MHAKCSAHTKAGKPCGQPVVLGATVCRYHGGSAPQVAAAAAVRVTLANARTTLGAYGIVDADELEALALGDVIQELLTAAAKQRATVLWLEAKVAAGDETGLMVTVMGVRSPSPYLTLLRLERQTYTALLVQLKKLGIEEEAVRQEQRRLDDLGVRVSRSFARAGLDLSDPMIQEILREEFGA